MSDYKRRLTYSEVKYGYLRIEKAYSDRCPQPGEKITINSESDFRMHSTQEGRIDGLTKLYKDNKVKSGNIAHISFNNKEIHISFQEGDSIFEKNELTKGYSSLQSAILRAQELISTKAYLFCKNETNVRSEIIEPILKTLGWELPYLAREKKCTDCRRKADYALYKDNRCVLVIEAKSLDISLPEKPNNDCAIQMNNYLEKLNASYGILTNGQVWQIRDKKDIAIIKSIDILDSTDKEKGIKDIEDFFLLFNNESFDCEKLKDLNNVEEPIHFTAEDRIKHFKIIENKTGEEIIKADPTKTFRAFINKYIDDVIDLQTLDCFNVTVVTEKETEVRNPKKSDSKNYYITGDHSTYQKRMIIQQIIDQKKLEARIETI